MHQWSTQLTQPRCFVLCTINTLFDFVYLVDWYCQVAGSTSNSGGDAPNEAYVLLTSDRGLSRSCRAAWFLQRLGHDLEEGTEEKYVT